MIHKFNMFGNFIVLDVESGCVHVVDELTFKMLDFIDFENKEKTLNFLIDRFKNYPQEEISKRFKEILVLFEKEVLFSNFDYAPFKNKVNGFVLKALCLHVAHDCNLRCKYCFASTGDFKSGRELMPFKTAMKAIDFLIENSKNRKNLEVDFFGGEPLLNFEVVKKTIEYARQKEKKFNKNFRFTITTNGILLNSNVIDYINKNMNNVVLSLDGRKKVNDRFRVTTNGNGSYDLVVKNIKNFIKKRGEKDYYVRGTFTKHNLDFLNDVISFYENEFYNMSIEPVVCEEKNNYSIEKEDLPIIFKEYEKLAEFIINKKKHKDKINFFHLNIDLSQGPCLIKRIRGCGAGCEYFAISPIGNIYPCHQFVGKKDFVVGNLFKNELKKDIIQKFSQTNLLNKKDCKNCWVKYYCAGGCCANNFKFSSDLLKPYSIACEIEKKRVECAIAIKVALAKLNV